MKEDMRGLFVVIKGQYSNKKNPSYINEKDGTKTFIGGYNPEDPDTHEWYMLYDTEVFMCHGNGSNLDKLLKNVYKNIVRYRTRNTFIKTMKGLDVIPSPIYRRMIEEIAKRYGDYFSDLVRHQEDLAYEVLECNTPQLKAKRKMKTRKHVVIEETPKETPVTPVETTKKRSGVIKKRKKRNIVCECAD